MCPKILKHQSFEEQAILKLKDLKIKVEELINENKRLKHREEAIEKLLKILKNTTDDEFGVHEIFDSDKYSFNCCEGVHEIPETSQIPHEENCVWMKIRRAYKNIPQKEK